MYRALFLVLFFMGVSLVPGTFCSSAEYEATVGMGFAVIERADNLWGDGHRAIKNIYSKPDPSTHLRVLPSFDVRAVLQKETDGNSRKADRSAIYLSTTANPGRLSTGVLLGFGKSSVDVHGFYSFFSSNWQNPYILYRKSTTTMNYGGKITYAGILNSDLSLSYQYAVTDVDKDLIGKLYRDLRQDGETHTVGLKYHQTVTKSMSIIPEFSYEQGVFEGKSNSYYRLTGGLGLIMRTGPAILNTRIFVNSTRFDGTHPIYTKTRVEDTYGGQFTALFPEPLGWKRWTLTAGVTGSRTGSNITFFDAYTLGIFTGLSRAF